MDTPESISYFFPQHHYNLLNGCYLSVGFSSHPPTPVEAS